MTVLGMKGEKVDTKVLTTLIDEENL